MSYQFFVKSNIDFGRGALSDLSRIIGGYALKSVMIVYDGGVKAAGIADRVIAEVEKAGVPFTVFDGVIPNPTNQVVEEAAQIAAVRREDVARLAQNVTLGAVYFLRGTLADAAAGEDGEEENA